ncbi:hypothetical protein GPECTOR_3g501 [Gonium pectorale]|uniref:Uncharacterized protein n=1 Tax=Gonium pectorale TaxID=33097 RepID=A0A150H018_GONPE|nr:hypothetical protein GPECTOR_3g501 [Gonium pectorale]|eukprot:KXZ55374.1 hypothetical protein GPECTOR_3g501 [Gonium pectorale]
MATDDSQPATVHGLFVQYAQSNSGSSFHGLVGVAYQHMKDLMLDLDLLEGVPPALCDAAVREHLQRADQEGAGVVGVQDFAVWFLTEVAALLPLRDAFCKVMGLRPLYNQYHAVLLGDVGFSPHAARRPATGMASGQFLRLVEQSGLLGAGGQEAARQAFKAARVSYGGLRGASGSSTGAKVAEPAGGSRLQFVAFVRAIMLLSARKEYLLSLGCLSPVRRHLPYLPLINARNLRAVFHRYNAVYNRGRLPPASFKLRDPLEGEHQEQPQQRRGSSAGSGGGGRPEEGCRGGGGDGGGAAGRHPAYGACCCLYRSLSAMELSSWLRLCSDCEAIRNAVSTLGSQITPAELEAAFVAASSIAGVYCPDDSAGLHDAPVSSGEGARLGLRRNGLGTVAAADGVRAAAKPVPPRTTAAYQASPAVGAHGAAAAAAAAAVAAAGYPPPPCARVRPAAPALHEVCGPTSRAAWLADARSLPYDDDAGATASPASGAAAAARAHRPARLCLTFPQFLEALRLVAEQACGHPASTAGAELALLRIVHDLVREGCPLPDPTTLGGTAQIRRQAFAAANTAADAAAAGADGAESLRSYESLPLSSHRQDAEWAATAAATAATSAGAPGQRPAAGSSAKTSGTAPRRVAPVGGSGAASGGGGALAGGPVGGWVGNPASSSAASTSTKYTYDDFTPPDSDAYTSATSSRVASRAVSEAAGWAAPWHPPAQPALQQSISLPQSPPSESQQQLRATAAAAGQRQPLQPSQSVPEAVSGSAVVAICLGPKAAAAARCIAIVSGQAPSRQEG